MKFEEAYVKPLDKIIDINELSLISRTDILNFATIRKQLYCPECRKAQLAYVSGNIPHLRTFPDAKHEEVCSLRQEELSGTALKLLLQQGHTQRVEKEIENVLFIMLENRVQKQVQKNDSTLSNKNRTIKGSARACTLNKRIPRKRIDLPMNDDDFGIPKIFYGQVFLRWKKKINTDNGYMLLLFSKPEDEEAVCLLNISPAVYSYLPKPYKKQSVAYCKILFFGEVKKTYNHKTGNSFICSTIRIDKHLRIEF